MNGPIIQKTTGKKTLYTIYFPSCNNICIIRKQSTHILQIDLDIRHHGAKELGSVRAGGGEKHCEPYGHPWCSSPTGAETPLEHKELKTSPLEQSPEFRSQRLEFSNTEAARICGAEQCIEGIYTDEQFRNLHRVLWTLQGTVSCARPEAVQGFQGVIALSEML